VGLFWSVLPEHRGQGYAAEAAQALIDYACQVMEVARLVASADYSNAASLRVMEKLGMRIERNAFEEPPYLQAIGVLENPAAP
jgi:ribosomal-protein-alanine N-acetyltransferase